MKNHQIMVIFHDYRQNVSDAVTTNRATRIGVVLQVVMSVYLPPTWGGGGYASENTLIPTIRVMGTVSVTVWWS